VSSQSPVDSQSNFELPTDGESPSKEATKEVLAQADIEQPQPKMPVLPKIIKFDSIARCGDEVWIENEGQIYRLRKTRQGKLILTK